MYKLGISLVLLALLSVNPATFAADSGVPERLRPRSTWSFRYTSTTACPFRRFSFLCHQPQPRPRHPVPQPPPIRSVPH